MVLTFSPRNIIFEYDPKELIRDICTGIFSAVLTFMLLLTLILKSGRQPKCLTVSAWLINYGIPIGRTVCDLKNSFRALK